MEQTPKNRKKGYIIAIAIVAIAVMGLVFSFSNTRRIRRSGVRTTATVTNVEIRHVTGGHGQRDRVRHYTTFRYSANGQSIIAVRTSEHTNVNTRPLRRVGEQVEIYYSARNPRNFVFAYGSPNSFGVFGIVVVGVFIVLSLPMLVVFFKFRAKLIKMANQGN